jgi:hypothetical protein
LGTFGEGQNAFCIMRWTLDFTGNRNGMLWFKEMKLSIKLMGVDLSWLILIVRLIGLRMPRSGEHTQGVCVCERISRKD